MPKFVAVPADWTAGQAEAYQREAQADGYTVGLSASIVALFGERVLPFTWSEDSAADQPPEEE